MSEPATLRRKMPTQTRAKARVADILKAATELIAETGSEHLKMSDIAARAGVPIGSVYQYFPDKAAIILTLADRIMGTVRDGLDTAMAAVETKADAEEALVGTLRAYYNFFLAEPVARDIWFGVQADKTLHELDIEDSRANGAISYRALRKLCPRKDWKRLETSCFLIMQLTGMAVRLAISVERKEGDRIMAVYEDMIRRELIGALEG